MFEFSAHLNIPVTNSSKLNFEYFTIGITVRASYHVEEKPLEKTVFYYSSQEYDEFE